MVASYQSNQPGRVRFVSENYGNSALAERFGIKRYPVIFVDEALFARPEDFGGWGREAGKYHPWRGDTVTHARFKKDLQHLIDLTLRGRIPVTTKQVQNETAQEIAVLPSVTTTDLNGQAITANDFVGRITIVEFWATWCGPCRSTLGWLGELKQRYGDKVEVLTIAVESEEAEVRQQLAALKPPLRVVLGTESMVTSFGGITSVPTMFVFDQQGQTAQVFYGAPEDLHPKVETLLRRLLK